MSYRGFILPLVVAALAFLPACHDHTFNLTHAEIDFLVEDVIDLQTVVFQAGENAFLGDVVLPGDVVDPAGPGNDFIVTYDLPFAMRIGLGEGFGRVALQVFEDGVPNPDPLSFSFATTTADQVDVVYDLRYEGEAALSGRLTVVDLAATLLADRTGPGAAFSVEYFIAGDCDLGATFCGIETQFRAPGRPRDGIEAFYGDGGGYIDDPDVYDIFDLDLDWLETGFVAEGEVGCCAFFEEFFFYDEVL